jgi:hypothetical protein
MRLLDHLGEANQRSEADRPEPISRDHRARRVTPSHRRYEEPFT